MMGLNKKCLLLWRVKDMRMLLGNIRKSVCPNTLEQNTEPAMRFIYLCFPNDDTYLGTQGGGIYVVSHSCNWPKKKKEKRAASQEQYLWLKLK